MPPAPPLPKKVQPLADPTAVTAKRTAAQTNARAITNPAPESDGITARTRAAPTVARPVEERDAAAVAGDIAVALTPAVRSAPLGAAVATATAAAATPRATATTAPTGDAGATQSGLRTLNTSDAAAEGGDTLGGVSTPPLPLRTHALAHAATAAVRGIGGTIAAAPAAPAPGAAAPAVAPGGAATAAAVAPQVAPHPPIKALLIVEEEGAEQTVTHTAETLTVLASIALSLHEQPHHEALIEIHIHPVHSHSDRAAPEMQESRKTHSLLDSFWRRSSPRKTLKILPQEQNLGVK